MDVDMDTSYSSNLYTPSPHFSTSTLQLSPAFTPSITTCSSPSLAHNSTPTGTPTRLNAGQIRMLSLQKRISLMQEIFGDPDEEAYDSAKDESEYDDSCRFRTQISEQETNTFLDGLELPPSQGTLTKRIIAGSRQVLISQANNKDPRIRAQVARVFSSSSVVPSPSRSSPSETGEVTSCPFPPTTLYTSVLGNAMPVPLPCQPYRSEDIEMGNA